MQEKIVSKELIGKTINNRTLLQVFTEDWISYKSHVKYWRTKGLVLCNYCNKTKEIRIENFLNSKCKCQRVKHNIDYYIGKKFNKITILSFSHKKGGHIVYNCICECGNEKQFILYNLLKTVKPTTSCGCSYKLKTGEAHFNLIFNSYVNNANKRNLEFNLSKEQVKEIIEKNCYYCGQAPKIKTGDVTFLKYSRKNGYFISNSIDRYDNNKGYLYENCVPCCPMCNTMKLNYNVNDFLEKINLIYRRHIKND
jgi:hypothetical protein